MTLKEFLNMQLPSDKLMKNLPGNPSVIANKVMKRGQKKNNKSGDDCVLTSQVPVLNQKVNVRKSDGSADSCTVSGFVNGIDGTVTHVKVIKNDGGKRTVRLNIV